MSHHRLSAKQIIPVSLEEAWDFFSSPKNLAVITPDDLDFKITSPVDSENAYPGQIISYQIRPLLGIPMNWVTEITQVKAPDYFVDTQLSGPYKFWHHEHHFKEVDIGTEITDILYYALPFGIIGSIVHSLFIRKRVEQIFTYRKKKLEELFGGQ